MTTFQEYSKNAIFFYDEVIPEQLKHCFVGFGSRKIKLADLGAGDGVLLAALHNNDLLSNVEEITAVDLSPERCKRLSAYKGINVICSDVTSIPEIADSSIDLLVSTQVIEHVDEEKFLSEISRIMKDDAKAYIASVISTYGADPYFIYKFGWMYGWRFYKSDAGRHYVDPTHLREYASLDQYVEVFRKNKFNIISANKYPLKISIIDFIYRRLILKIFKIHDVNSHFEKHKLINYFREKLKIQPPGYYVCEVVIEKF